LNKVLEQEQFVQMRKWLRKLQKKREGLKQLHLYRISETNYIPETKEEERKDREKKDP
jgi:hypothetical protein